MPRSSARKSSGTGTRKRTSKVKTYKKTGAARRRKSPSRKPRKNTARNILIAVVFCIALLFIFLAFSYNKLTQSIVSADSPSAFSILNQPWYTILVEKENEYLFSIFDVKNGRLVSYKIPLDISLDLPGKFGEELLSKSTILGALGGGSGEELFDLSVTKIFGVRPDKHIKAKEGFNDRYESFYRYIQSSDLELNELYNLYKFTVSLSPDEVIVKDLSQSLVNSPESLDADIRNITLDSPMSLEKKSISILNGARVPGLAGYGSRLVENAGGYVVSVGNSSIELKESLIISDDPDSATVSALARQFGINRVVTKAQTDITDNEVMRSDVVVILGVDKAGAL